MRPDVVIEARAWINGAFQDAEIGLSEETGRILAVKKTLSGGDRRKFPGLLLLPSAVDLHVHFRDPGHPAKEDFASGTRAAAMGGVGTILDMPNTDPVVDRKARVQEKAERVAANACVDWGLWGTLTDATPDAFALCKAADAVKLYLAPTTGIPGAMGDEALSLRLESCRRAARLTALHAETAEEGAPADLLAHHRLRPPSGEVAAIERARRLATDPHLVHVAHASTAAALEAATKAGFSAGVTPHHLLLSADEGDLGTRGKVNPPLRPFKERLQLWDAFAAGKVPIIETDHAPHTIDDKTHEFQTAPAGLPGVETAFPLLLRECHRRKLSIENLVRAYCETPARRLGLATGRIQAGYDADFFLFDPRQTATIKGSELQTKCGWTPFEGWESIPVIHHFLRGQPVVEDGAFAGKRGLGRRIQPRLEPAYDMPVTSPGTARSPSPTHG